MLSIARRVCADAVRGAVRDRPLPLRVATGRSAPAFGTTDPADTVSMRTLLAALTTERREAFVLTQIVGLSYAETADVCDCPIGTVRSRVARARADLVAAVDAGSGRRAGHG